MAETTQGQDAPAREPLTQREREHLTWLRAAMPIGTKLAPDVCRLCAALLAKGALDD